MHDARMIRTDNNDPEYERNQQQYPISSTFPEATFPKLKVQKYTWKNPLDKGSRESIL